VASEKRADNAADGLRPVAAGRAARDQRGLALLADMAKMQAVDLLPTADQEVLDGSRPAAHGNRVGDPDAGSSGRHRRKIHPEALPSMARPSATVLIPAHNEANTVYQLVRACAEQPYPLEDIIVVADACTDDTADKARQAGATVVLEVNYQDKALSQNAALWDIWSDVIVGFDGDTIPEPDCIELMIRDIENGYDATCATVLPIQPRGFWIRARRFAYALGRRWWRLCQAQVGRIQVLTGAAYVFKTEAIKGVGGFPGGLISADMDATWSLHRARRKLGYAGDAIALTYDPETFRVYKQQMRRWSSGYFQNMAKYRRELLHPKAMLVVWTALFDLCCLFAYEVGLLVALATGHFLLVKTLSLWLGIHAIITTVMVATVVGPKEAVLGYFPYLIANYYKWLYLCAFVREWILGRHYSSWTGRQGRKTVITKMTRKRKAGLACVVAVAAFAVGGTYVIHQKSQPPALAFPSVTTHASRYLGVITSNPTTAELQAFRTVTGARITIDEYYSRWGSPFNSATAEAMDKAGALPMISWEPFTVSPARIATGRSDSYITSYARAVAAYGKPIVISFAAEMNGDWEKWGPLHSTASQFVAAWRHIHDLFAKAGARNVTWIWAPAPSSPQSRPFAAFYPGDAYVNWIGLDEFWWNTRPVTFDWLLGPSIAQLRVLTAKPLLISETAAVPGAKVMAVKDLFQGAETTPGVIGFVWFDVKAARNWPLEEDQAAVAAYRQESRIYMPPPRTK
jgi:cellulose synthase/poly-beta-1,6-N-acetylglucosamine synthase-like glycosyltransferase